MLALHGFYPTVVSDPWRRMSRRTSCLGICVSALQSRFKVIEFGALEEERAAAGPSASLPFVTRDVERPS